MNAETIKGPLDGVVGEFGATPLEMSLLYGSYAITQTCSECAGEIQYVIGPEAFERTFWFSADSDLTLDWCPVVHLGS